MLNAAGPQFAIAVFNASRTAGVDHLDHLDLSGAAQEPQRAQDEARQPNSRLAPG